MNRFQPGNFSKSLHSLLYFHAGFARVERTGEIATVSRFASIDKRDNAVAVHMASHNSMRGIASQFNKLSSLDGFAIIFLSLLMSYATLIAGRKRDGKLPLSARPRAFPNNQTLCDRYTTRLAPVQSPAWMFSKLHVNMLVNSCASPAPSKKTGSKPFIEAFACERYVEQDRSATVL